LKGPDKKQDWYAKDVIAMTPGVQQWRPKILVMCQPHKELELGTQFKSKTLKLLENME
jgi:hypothetical protein